MGRPVKNKTERKDTDLRIPVTAEQKELVLRAVKIDGMDMASWARPILLKEAQKRIKANDDQS